MRGATRNARVKRDLRVDGDDDSTHLVDLIADPLNENDVLLVFQDVAAIRRDVESDADIEVDDYSQR